MTTTIHEKNGIYVAVFEGRLDTPASLQTQKDVQPLLENADKEIVLDCKDLEYISSSGLRIFLTLRKEAASKGGKVIIENIRPDIKKVFEMTGFYKLFEVRE